MAKHAANYASQATAKEAGDPTAPEAVANAYNSGVNEHWRAFLKALAHESLVAQGDWVDWKHLCDMISIDRRKGAGMLGAAQKRLGGQVPFERDQVGDTYRFKMTPEVANTVLALAKKGTDESLDEAGEPPITE
ncbi:hypothetical protein CFP71_21355 [Amycolatopsis thailandensis]|uniref:MarR family transcriptional regulator n=2 Tax=Pseudonocardiaceae TaxID=2070 RepID=A0A229S4T1_9PSEU|nr:hypothetical protein CFP71_21355 [Amycolatopsis thailandensis]